MAKDQKKRQKQKQKKAAKNKAKRDQLKKKERINLQKTSEIVADEVDFALELAMDGDITKASAMLNKLKKKHSRNPNVQFGLGVFAVHTGDMDKGIEHFNKVIELDPQCVKAYFNLASAYQEQVNIKGMVESLRNIIELRHIDAELADEAQEWLDDLATGIKNSGSVDLDQFIEAQSAFETGFGYMEQHDFKEAILHFKKALSMNPEPPQTYGNLGLCYAYLGEKETALDYLDKALERDPTYEVASSNRSLVEQLEPGEAVQLQEVKSINYYLDHERRRYEYDF